VHLHKFLRFLDKLGYRVHGEYQEQSPHFA
jgi:hypothetical protein